MSDISSVPAEASTVIDPAIVAPPNPIDVDNVDHAAEAAAKAKPEPKAKDEPVKKPSTREALEAARAKMDKAEAVEKAKPEIKTTAKPGEKVEEKHAKDRDETGKFKGKEPADDAAKTAGAAAKLDAEPGKGPGKTDQSSHDDQAARPPADEKKRHYDEAPARFSPEAKAAWKDVPEHARAETHRMLREYETGIEEHRKRFEPIKPYDDLAKKHGTDLPSALKRYLDMDQLLNDDWEAGLESILRDKGLPPLRALAAHLLDRKPEENQQRADSNTQRLEQMVDQLSKQVQGLGGHVQQTVLEKIDTHVSAFSADKPWFDALQHQIAGHIKAGLSLEEAAEKAHTEAMEQAKALGFAEPAAPQTAAQTGRTEDETVAQTDAGKKSISGAPGVGTIAAVKKPSGSIRDSIRKAAREAAGD